MNRSATRGRRCGGAALAALLTVTTILASWIPARRAARIDPAVALAGE